MFSVKAKHPTEAGFVGFLVISEIILKASDWG